MPGWNFDAEGDRICDKNGNCDTANAVDAGGPKRKSNRSRAEVLRAVSRCCSRATIHGRIAGIARRDWNREEVVSLDGGRVEKEGGRRK